MEGSFSHNFAFSAALIMRSDNSEHISSLILWSNSEEDSTGVLISSLTGDDDNLGSSMELNKFNV
jgi:hypothetical protein